MTVSLGTACWTDVAPNWDRYRDAIEQSERALTDRLLALLPDLTGRDVLELGAGTGALSERLADLVGPEGHVIATDLAEGMVERLHAHLDARPHVEVRRLDAAAIDLAAATVDAVVFRMGLMMTADPLRALGEVLRVLRPEGTFVTAVWSSPQHNPWLTTVGMAAAMTGLVAPLAGPPARPGEPFSLADPGRLRELATDAGFREVSVETVDGRRHYPDAATHVAMVTAMAPPLAAAVAAATPEQVEQLHAQVRSLLSGFETDTGMAIPMQAHLLSVRR